MVDQAKATFQNLKKCFSKKKNELKKSNKSQINQIFTRRIKSYLKRTPFGLVSFFVLSCWIVLFLLVYEIIPVLNFLLFLLFFFFILNKTISCKNKMSFPSESDMMSKELRNSDLIFGNLMTDAFKIIAKYGWKIIAKYHHFLPSGNRALVLFF